MSNYHVVPTHGVRGIRVLQLDEAYDAFGVLHEGVVHVDDTLRWVGYDIDIVVLCPKLISRTVSIVRYKSRYHRSADTIVMVGAVRSVQHILEWISIIVN